MTPPKLIAFSGKKGHGKDYCSKLFVEFMGGAYIRLAFADGMKKEIANALDIKVAEIDKDKILFRPVMQWWGTEWRRGKFGDDYWVNKWGSAYEYVRDHSGSNMLVVVPDVRFPNEAKEIVKQGGLLIRVIGVNMPGEPVDSHTSETALDGYKFDHVIKNDFGDYAATVTQVRKIVEGKL